MVELSFADAEFITSNFYSGRIFVNQSIPTRTYFGSNSAPLNQDPEHHAIDLCSSRQTGSPARNSSIDGNYDMANFIWFEGDGTLFQNSSGNVEFI